MFSQIFDAIEEWMRELLTGMITSNLDTMFTDVNQKTGEIATQVGQTPQGWNGSIFSMIRNLSDSVIFPQPWIVWKSENLLYWRWKPLSSASV